MVDTFCFAETLYDLEIENELSYFLNFGARPEFFLKCRLWCEAPKNSGCDVKRQKNLEFDLTNRRVIAYEFDRYFVSLAACLKTK